MTIQTRAYRLGSTIAIAAMLLAAIGSPGLSPSGGTVHAQTTVFINEIHYDNVSTDSGEAVEIAGPAGTDLTGWSLVLYNGNGGAMYDTIALDGVLPDQQDGFGTRSFPAVGIQNGAPDGLALVDPTSSVAQFLSYEGTFTAVGGPADGLPSTDIGVLEDGSGPVGDSLQLTGTGNAYEHFTWVGDATNTFDSVNTGQTFVAGPVMTDPTGVGAADPDVAERGDTTLLSVAITPGENPTSTGLGVSCDLSAIGGSTAQDFFDDGTSGDVTADDNVFSYSVAVDSSATPGDKTLPCNISDAEGRSGSTSIALNVHVVLPVPSVFINEIHYDNAGTDSGEAIEVAGPAGMDLTGWSLVRYNGSNGQVYTSPGADPVGSDVLSGAIPDLGGGYGVVVVNYPTNGLQNGNPDGVALVDSGSNVIQFLSYEGSFAATAGPATGLTSTDIGVGESSSTPVGESLQLIGKGTTYDDFAWSGPAASSFGAINAGECLGSCPTGEGYANPSVVQIGDSSLLTVVVTPAENPASTNLAVTCDLSAIGGASDQSFYDDGTGGGDVTGDDNVFSFTATPAADIAVSSNDFPCTITDSQSRTGNTTIHLDVVLPIGTVQGSVGNSDDGFNFDAPLAGQQVTIQGVIYENLLARSSSGGDSHTFFIQNTASTADGDPNSSDGLYVYIGYYSTLRVQGGGYYTPQVGDEVILQGPIQEFYGQTELSNPYVLSVVGHYDDIDTAVPAFSADPPPDLQDAYRYWERREGMRGEVPDGSIILNGRDVFASTADAEVWAARPDSVIADRSDPYERRAFRDAHPLDDNYDPNSWDGNGYRILMGSLGIKSAANDNTAMIAPSRTFDTLDGGAIGGVYFDFGKYSIQPGTQVTFTGGVDPSLNAPPQTFNRAEDFSIVDFNMENLYDYRNNPLSGCDFAADTGCDAVYPFISGVTPPYDYVPDSDGAYQARLNDIALQIVNDLHSPDIVMAQEIENQDVCTVTEGAMDCGTADNADGQPDSLQDLAVKIADLGGPDYASAFDRDSSDLRGIAPAFMYRTDRVQLLDPTGDPVLDGSPTIDGYTAVPYDGDTSNPKTLNAEYTGSGACETEWVFPRAPSIALFRIYHAALDQGPYNDVYVINNHFKSGPDTCVAHRTEQANYNAAIVSFLQGAKPDARIVVGGDLNVYPRPDDPFAPLSDLASTSDQLGALYGDSLGMTNLWDKLLEQAPEAAYSYVYQGQAQTLDQMFVNQPMLADLQQFRSAHVNSDFPADYPGDVARGTSDHDPQFGEFRLPDITFEELQALFQYYVDSGDITGNNTAKALMDHLTKAARFEANGQDAAYRAQLQAFINQVQGKAPQFVTQDAADALSGEAAALLGE